MNKIKQMVNAAYSDLLEDLKSGDEQVGWNNPTSKKAGEHRIRFLNTIREKLISKEITQTEANQATRLFGRKTSKLFWLKNK